MASFDVVKGVTTCGPMAEYWPAGHTSGDQGVNFNKLDFLLYEVDHVLWKLALVTAAANLSKSKCGNTELHEVGSLQLHEVGRDLNFNFDKLGYATSWSGMELHFNFKKLGYASSWSGM